MAERRKCVSNILSDSSNYKSKSVQFDRADYGALINLANKASKVKAYSYYNFTNTNAWQWCNQQQHCWSDQGQQGCWCLPDPISLSDVTRGYVANTQSNALAMKPSFWFDG